MILGVVTLGYQGFRAARTAHYAGQATNQFDITLFDDRLFCVLVLELVGFAFLTHPDTRNDYQVFRRREVKSDSMTSAMSSSMNQLVHFEDGQ